MKITFEDHSYIEISKLPITDKIMITIGAKDGERKTISIINSVELTQEQFAELVKLQ